jgi:diguanylate cyclase (GGDEF)-like protein
MIKNRVKNVDNNKIAHRVRNMSILLLAMVLFLITAIAFVIVTELTLSASKDLAHLYSLEAESKFTVYTSRALILGERISKSKTVSEWFLDEENPVKKMAAIDEISNTAGMLNATDIYFGIHESLNEYSIENGKAFENLLPFGILTPDNPLNYWYYNSINSDNEYSMNIDTGRPANVRKLRINHKITDGRDITGVFSSGLPVEEMAHNLFYNYDSRNVSGHIIDRNGVIQIDSRNDYSDAVCPLMPDPRFAAAVKSFFDNADGFFGPDTEPVLIKLNGESFRYVSIAPITNTDWLVVIFFNSTSLFSFTRLLPLIIAMFSAFLFYTMAENILIRRIVLNPLAGLTASISESKTDCGNIYGLERGDEIGKLAKTIYNMREVLLQASNEKERLIRTDQLTNLPNRRFFDERLLVEWERAVRASMPISILMLDLDHFKKYNDTHGHLNGDKVLRTVSKIFTKELKRPADFVVRWGGEEFAVIVPDTGSHGAAYLAENIRRNVENAEILLDDGAVTKITVSIGVNTMIPTYGCSTSDFIRQADDALYKAKDKGRNRVCIYS